MIGKRFLIGCLAATLAVGASRAAAPDASGVDLTTKKDALRAIDIGLQWLKKQQHEDGSWSLKDYPAITALVTRAILQDPAAEKGKADAAATKGLEYIASCMREDGGIYCEVPRQRGGSVRNYNTAISMQTLAACGQTKYVPLVIRARRFIVQSQCLAKGDYCGGWGYDLDPKRPYADITNTGFVIEALAATAGVAREWERESKRSTVAPTAVEVKPAGDAPLDPDWRAANAFLSKCQNLASADDKDKTISRRPQDLGGFIYNPNGSIAGGEKDEEGKQMWHSYGNATTLGLACLLQSNVARADPRVTATVEWLRANYTIEEHAGGMGKRGLYFYYHTLAKALSLYGEEPLKRGEKPAAQWRRELMIKLVSLQRIQQSAEAKDGLGYWVNDEGQWMENDPVLVTAYSILSLESLVAEPRP